MITFTQLGKMGRLGNCLFQIAAVITHAEKCKQSWVLPRWQYEKDFPWLAAHFENKITPTRIYTEPYFHYAPLPDVKNNEVLDLVGYFQSWRYIDFFLTRTFLRFEKELERQDDKCSIHVRRGDYVHQPQNHPTQGMNYYEHAMSFVPQKKFIVFSDDISWCKQHFIGNSFEFSEGQSEVDDLNLMSSCGSNIIANSSFSYMGAVLNFNVDKKVVAPRNWFGPNLPHSTKDLCPVFWNRI